ncbi:MAG: serine/threonine protein kinase [SAR202 cluster bacterium]|nr:serine/threonine protein kinase [SAR202 cluster bacterium]
MVSLPPGSTLGRYRVIQQLGRGGMATVFKAFDPTLDRHVAIKVLPSFDAPDPTFTARFANEAQTVAKLRHPNIVQVFDFGEDKGFSFIVSELVSGGTLQDKLTGKPLAAADVLKYMTPLADALDYAHSQGIIHRDLKPANVLLDEQERPILADFGLARMLQSMSRFTQAQQALGTPEYMAPEQAMGADADNRSDLYAIGVMLFQMLLGETPYHADTPAATLMAHVHRPLPLPSALNPGFSPRLEAVVLKSLAKDPNDRYQSAKELINALALAAGESMPFAESARKDPAGTQGMTQPVSTSQIAMTGATDAVTAVMQPSGARPVAPSAPSASVDAGVAPAPAARRKPVLLWAGGGGLAVVGVVVALVLVFTLGGGDEGGTTQQTDTARTQAVSSGELLRQYQEMVTRVKANVVSLRELDDDGVQEPQFRSRDDLRAITSGMFERPALRDQVYETQELYKALGLMAPDQDLRRILTDIQVQQVSALFDDVAGQVYVVSDSATIGAAEELAFASAYAGATLQERFDVGRLRQAAVADSLDRTRAVDALVRGDVFQVVQGYIGSHMTTEQVEKLSQPLPQN